MPTWLEHFWLAFIPQFVAIDAIGLVAIFLSMTQGMEDQRRRIARQATWTAAIVAVLFMFLGRFIFQAIGITVADFEIAGGLILLILATRDLTGSNSHGGYTPQDTGIVPLGMPLIAGPGLLSTLLILVRTLGTTTTIIALLANMALLHLALSNSEHIVRVIGLRGLRAFSKIIALLLAAIAVSMIRRGWQSL